MQKNISDLILDMYTMERNPFAREAIRAHYTIEATRDFVDSQAEPITAQIDKPTKSMGKDYAIGSAGAPLIMTKAAYTNLAKRFAESKYFNTIDNMLKNFHTSYITDRPNYLFTRTFLAMNWHKLSLDPNERFARIDLTLVNKAVQTLAECLDNSMCEEDRVLIEYEDLSGAIQKDEICIPDILPILQDDGSFKTNTESASPNQQTYQLFQSSFMPKSSLYNITKAVKAWSPKSKSWITIPLVNIISLSYANNKPIRVPTSNDWSANSLKSIGKVTRKHITRFEKAIEADKKRNRGAKSLLVDVFDDNSILSYKNTGNDTFVNRVHDMLVDIEIVRSISPIKSTHYLYQQLETEHYENLIVYLGNTMPNTLSTIMNVVEDSTLSEEQQNTILAMFTTMLVGNFTNDLSHLFCAGGNNSLKALRDRMTQPGGINEQFILAVILGLSNLESFGIMTDVVINLTKNNPVYAVGFGLYRNVIDLNSTFMSIMSEDEDDDLEEQMHGE